MKVEWLKIPILAACLLIISVSLVSPAVASPQTTSISQVVSPSVAVAGNARPLPVVVVVTYNNTTPGYHLVVGILNQVSSPHQLVPGTVVSSTDPCVNQGMVVALCRINVTKPSGSERINFQIGGIFGGGQKPGTWILNATSLLVDQKDALVPGSVSSKLFKIELTSVKLNVNVPSNVSVTIDGVVQPPGPASVAVGLGQHNVTVPQLVNVSRTTRLRFDHWSDNNPSITRTIVLSNSRTIQADYVTQNLLTLVGVQGNVTSGWYDADSNATFSTNQYEPAPDGLGALGLRLSFQGWYENGQLVTSSPNGTISMDTPHTLTAEWQADYTIPAVIVVAIIAVAIVAFMVTRRKTRTRRTRRRSKRARNG